MNARTEQKLREMNSAYFNQVSTDSADPMLHIFGGQAPVVSADDANQAAGRYYQVIRLNKYFWHEMRVNDQIYYTYMTKARLKMPIPENTEIRMELLKSTPENYPEEQKLYEQLSAMDLAKDRQIVFYSKLLPMIDLYIGMLCHNTIHDEDFLPPENCLYPDVDFKVF